MTMPLTIETVPESIPFERVQELVHSLGMDTRDLKAFRLDRNAITAEVYARNAEDQRYFVVGTREVAVHHIVIPVTPLAERFTDTPE